MVLWYIMLRYSVVSIYGTHVMLFPTLLSHQSFSKWPIPVAARSTTQVSGCLLAGIAGSNLVRGLGYLSLVECCLLAGRVLCDRPITRPEESCRLCLSDCDLETNARVGLLRHRKKKQKQNYVRSAQCDRFMQFLAVVLSTYFALVFS